MTIIAKYKGVCSKCDCQIKPGENIEWSKGSPTYHTRCPDVQGIPADKLMTISRSSGYGGVNYTVGKFYWVRDKKIGSKS